IAKDIILSEKQLSTWGNNPKADLQIISKKKINGKTEVKSLYKNKTISFTIPFTDSASIENALHCAASMLFLGYDPVIIKKRMLALCQVAMRLELKEGINGCSIINDSYSSDITSLSIALDFLNQQKQHPTRTVILSDILQSGRKTEELFTEVASLLEGLNVDKLIGIGPEISSQRGLFSMQKSFYTDTEDFINRFDFASLQNEAILLKGARKFAFEKISRILQQKTHETILEINLDALIHNLNYYRSKLVRGTKIMAMVKAFSYGSGSFEIASLLQYHHTDYLSVAYADEGYELRKAGITLPIMVMNADEQSVETLLRNDLEPEIYSFRMLTLLEEAISNYNGGLPQPVKIHIKVDTGMYRLGFELQDLDKLTKQLMDNPMITIGSVFSHLAASEVRFHDDFTRYQIDLFKKMSEKICSQFDYKILCHILNSAGISRFPEAQFDMVRLGISLYGIASVENEQHALEHVSTLRSTISQIKKVPANETIGYNRQWKATKDMAIAIVPIGYADGLSRRLSNGIGKLFINGHPAPVVGNVCMDMCMVDISKIEASEGDEVIVFSKDHPITELAHDLGTIPYEVLTGISRRVKRVYFQE
ncbi:MAG: bifunctional UDP-N-acetylmuramoyl-tripeptide:D-alanyl-D-alanine ligase/alanine racemase, partial [Bacteroidales bacterium]|nr:bifunctional UDP-N-acetylmuramoyl-tripeptide:D-alanyl-D-alanine ligase/alanine racemase [Bacteroidales bacterium]